ncbi:vacuolar protein-sorting-associated protein 25-like protein, partial [Dinothrombium tinctorium]
MKKLRGILAVCGTACVYCAMGMYFSSGNIAVYLSSYLRMYSDSNVQLSDNMWFLAAVGLSAVVLPIGGWLDSIVGVRIVCLLAGILQSLGIFATYFALETNFISVVICYGGSFFLSCGIAYTPPLANINKWFPEKKGLVTGIVAASMAAAPSVWTPIITAFVNPENLPPDENGYFNDYYVLERTRQSLLLQGSASLVLFLIGISFIFPAPTVSELENKRNQVIEMSNYVSKKEIMACKMCTIKEEYGLTPKQAIKTKVFALLSLKIMVTELVFYYLLFVYKSLLEKSAKKKAKSGVMGFEYPWHYSFPPFFTIQPNTETRKVQLEAWRSLILSYCKANRIHTLDVQQSLKNEIFCNRKINRELNYESLMIILDYLREKGSIEWFDKKKSKCYVYWKTPNEWANVIYDWAQSRSLINTVCTFYEIVSGDDTLNESFHGLDTDILIKAIEILEKEGKAALISIDDGHGPFGQTFISDDFLLSAIGACASIGNAMCRLFVGHLKDIVSYKKCCVPMSGAAAILVCTLILTTKAHPLVYAVWIVIAVSIVGSQYALMPSAVTEYFGEKYASINIGLVYMST